MMDEDVWNTGYPVLKREASRTVHEPDIQGESINKVPQGSEGT